MPKNPKSSQKKKTNGKYKPKKMSLEKLIDKRIEKKVNPEDKQAWHSTPLGTLSACFQEMNSTNWHRLIPNVPAGVGENDRIGDQLKAKTLTVKGYFKFNHATATGQYNFGNVAVRLLICSLKVAPSHDTFSTQVSTYSPQLLRKGGTTTSFSGYLTDLYADLNTELWTKHYNKVYYLNQPVMNTMVGDQNLANTVKFFKIKLPFKKVLKYTSGTNSDLLPTNAFPVMFVSYVYLNAATPAPGSSQLGLSFSSEMTFEDS